VRIVVLGAGAWGTALSLLLAENGHDVFLWAHRQSAADDMRHDGRNQRHLPERAFPVNLVPIGPDDPFPVVDGWVVAVPSQYVRGVLMRYHGLFSAGAPVILACKGIEIETGLLMTDVVADIMPDVSPMLLSGPSFAHDLAKGLPTAVALACTIEREQMATEWQQVFSSRCFRPYLNLDPIGVAVGGAVKNVIAIACGIASGRGLGANAHAALLTRGLAEITRLAVACGGRTETMMGLAGLGDLSLTCSNTQSRNMSLGLALGQGIGMADYCRNKVDVIEGIPNARAVVNKAAKMGVEMPICRAVYDILHEGAEIAKAIDALLMRPLRAE